MAERAAIVGVGQTYHSSRRPDVNQIELINEAVVAALEDAELTIKDIECVIFGNMEECEGNYLMDCWATMATGAYMKEGCKIYTGGTTGTTVTVAAANHIASGLFDTVLAVAFEKQDEAVHGMEPLGLVVDPLWRRRFRTGAGAAGWFSRVGRTYMLETGCTEDHAAMVRLKADQCAMRNPYAHLRLGLTHEDILKSPMLLYPLRLLYLCPTSSGACAAVFASEKKAQKITNKPVWVRDWVNMHYEEEGFHGFFPKGQATTLQKGAKALYARNGITNVRREIQLAEIYEPSTWAELQFSEWFHFFENGEAWRMVEKGATGLEGEFPINPSGGVVCTNPIGCTAILRVAEAALQIRGDAGDHQVTRDVNTAVATGFGGSFWSEMILLSRNKD